MENATIEESIVAAEDVAALKRDVQSLTSLVESLRAQLAAQAKAIAELTSRLSATAPAAKPQPAPPPPAEEPAISQEVLVVIAAAVAAFLGKKIRIHSVKMESPYEIINPWAQQGRVFVQASHYLHRM